MGEIELLYDWQKIYQLKSCFQIQVFLMEMHIR